MVESFNVGAKLKVSYMDHRSSTELKDAFPEINEAIGYFVKNDSTFNSYDYIVLAMDLGSGEPLHPYSAILWQNVVVIKKLVEEK